MKTSLIERLRSALALTIDEYGADRMACHLAFMATLLGLCVVDYLF